MGLSFVLPAAGEMSFYARLLCVILLLFVANWGMTADLLTPSGMASSSDESGVLGDIVPVDLDEISAEILETFPIAIGRYEDISVGYEHWRGPTDASLEGAFSLTPTAIYVEGILADDYPFCQRELHPARPEWWKLTYGADGIVFTLEDETSAARRIVFALNWGSRATAPRIDIISSLLPVSAGFSRSGCLMMEDSQGSEGRTGSQSSPGRYHFRAGIPLTELADPQFFTERLRLKVELHDFDGDYSTATVLRTTLRLRKPTLTP